ncbi:MAG: hypothetical protein IJF54_03400 [Clostridia bacterium]|nr:hypothetical protein [Clostridia bacterium]
MSNVIYDAQPSYGGLSPVFIILLLVYAALIIYYIYGWIKKADIGFKIFFAIAILILTLVISSSIYTHIESKSSVYGKYKSGDYSIVEGEIYNYNIPADPGRHSDVFYVGDCEFIVPGFTTIWGYPLRQKDGGILKDGMRVKIYYVKYKFDNVMMRLEVLDEIEPQSTINTTQ